MNKKLKFALLFTMLVILTNILDFFVISQSTTVYDQTGINVVIVPLLYVSNFLVLCELIYEVRHKIEIQRIKRFGEKEKGTI